MYYNGSMLKARARTIMANSTPRIINGALIFVAVSFILSFLSSRLMGTSISMGEYEQILTQIEQGNMNYAYAYLERSMPSTGESLINLAIEIVNPIISAGFIIFLLNSIRASGACYGNLLDGFGLWWKIVVMSILQGIFIMLWTMLLIVPGIIAAYRYRQAIYILLDNPDMRPLDCIRMSKHVMTGHTKELFLLDLSFLGWTFLALVPGLGWIAQVWLSAYSGTAYALYYEQLLGNLDMHSTPGYDGYM